MTLYNKCRMMLIYDFEIGAFTVLCMQVCVYVRGCDVCMCVIVHVSLAATGFYTSQDQGGEAVDTVGYLVRLLLP